MVKGTVKWFNAKKGYGFIEATGVDGDIFVHFSEIQQDGYKALDEGDIVEFEVFQDEKGAKAKSVVRA